MRSVVATAMGLALSTASLVPPAVVAQAAPTPQSLTPAEAEAYQMSLTLAGSCSPQRQGEMSGSESVIRRPEPLAGTAALVQGVEGTFVVLERYSESLEGHCLVLGWFGGPLEPGRYPIQPLATSAVEAEVGTDDHSFYGMFAVRSAAESSVFVADSGSVELATVGPGNVTGTFDVSGFVVERSTRTGTATLQGSFTALEPPEE